LYQAATQSKEITRIRCRVHPRIRARLPEKDYPARSVFTLAQTNQGPDDIDQSMEKIAEGLHKKGAVKRYDKVLEHLGRLREKYARAAQYYEVTVEHDASTDRATAITWQRTKPIAETLPGVYCLRTNEADWDEATLWRTYTMLTDLEAVFRSLKSELGLRPIFHRKTHRVSGHLFISVLAYHLVHRIRFQLKAAGIHLSWGGIRRALAGQDRVTVTFKRADGKTIHIRKATRAEPRQQVIYDALGISDRPGRTEKTITWDPTNSRVVP